MSAGPFLVAKYATDDGEIRPIRIQPETLFGDNEEPSGGADGPYVKVSLGKRAFGLHVRKATLAKSVGTADYGTAKTYATVVFLTKAALDDLVVGSTVAYRGTDWIVVSKRSEFSK